MLFYKKILIAIIIVIISYVLWKLIVRRNKPIYNKEGFVFFSSPETDLSSLKKDNNVKIQNTNVKQYDLPLKEFCIKASYNSAYTGSYINKDMVKYVISRGCRFLDFEVYMIEGKPYVGYSTDPSYTILDTKNSVLLDNIFNIIVSNAFTTLGCPNSSDPIFINLRIKSNDPSVYKEVAKTVDVNLKSKLYDKQVTKTTKLSALIGKIILTIDKTLNYDYKSLSKCSPSDKYCIDLSRYVTLENGSEDLFLIKYNDIMRETTNPVHILNDNIHTDVRNMMYISPDINSKTNNNMFQLIKDYGAQIVPYRFYFKDAELTKYEDFFDENKSAFVPLSNLIKYVDKYNNI
jgi:hypothetical protein